jgi:hypothetical protein
MNYTELETAIQDYCQNAETSFVSHINEFIISAENKAYEIMQGALYYAFSTGLTTVADQESYTTSDGIPSGIVDINGIRLGETAGVSLLTAGPVRSLLVKDYEFLSEAYQTVTIETGTPKYYAVTAASSGSGNEPEISLRLAPIPDAAYTTEIQYQSKISTASITNGNTPGTTSTDTTWISVVVPDALLYGALVQGYVYMKGEADVMAVYQKQFDDALVLLKNLTEKRQTTDTYKANNEGNA